MRIGDDDDRRTQAAAKEEYREWLARRRGSTSKGGGFRLAEVETGESIARNESQPRNSIFGGQEDGTWPSRRTEFFKGYRIRPNATEERGEARALVTIRSGRNDRRDEGKF